MFYFGVHDASDSWGARLECRWCSGVLTCPAVSQSSSLTGCPSTCTTAEEKKKKEGKDESFYYQHTHTCFHLVTWHCEQTNALNFIDLNDQFKLF